MPSLEGDGRFGQKMTNEQLIARWIKNKHWKATVDPDSATSSTYPMSQYLLLTNLKISTIFLSSSLANDILLYTCEIVYFSNGNRMTAVLFAEKHIRL